MRFEYALKIFQHTLDVETRVNIAINLGLLKLAKNQAEIEEASQNVSEALAKGERVWMTSDLHFGHENIITYSDRPHRNARDMNEALVQQLSKVGNELVIFAGDMFMGDQENAIELIRRIPGRKILVAGNHDFSRDGKCVFRNADLFEAVVPFLFWKTQQGQEVLVTHYPAAIPDSMKRLNRLLNYHGHLHQKTLPAIDTIKYMNVGWDVHHSIHCL